MRRQGWLLPIVFWILRKHRRRHPDHFSGDHGVGAAGRRPARVIASVLGGSVRGGFLAHDAEEFTSDQLWVLGLNRNPGHAEAVSANTRTSVSFDKWNLRGPGPATKIAPEILGIHIKGVSARSMHGGPWYFQREFAMMVVCRTDCLLALAPASCF